MPGGQINYPLLGKHYSLPFLPATPSSPSRTLERPFELTGCPSRALALPRALLAELLRNMDTIKCVVLGAEVLSRTNIRNLDCAFVKMGPILKHTSSKNWVGPKGKINFRFPQLWWGQKLLKLGLWGRIT